MQIKLIAKKSGRFGNQRMERGQPFSTQPAYAKIWVALGLAEYMDAPEAPRARPDRGEVVTPSTVFDNMATETDDERHSRLYPDAVAKPEGDDAIGAMDTSSAPGIPTGKVNTPESEAPAPAPAVAPAPAAPVTAADDIEEIDEPADMEVDEMKTLRAQYEEIVGKKPYMGWKADQLREKITEFKSED